MSSESTQDQNATSGGRAQLTRQADNAQTRLPEAAAGGAPSAGQAEAAPGFSMLGAATDPSAVQTRAAYGSPDAIMRKAGPQGGGGAPSSGGGGAPLPDGVREKMENAMGADFSNVRVHEGGEAKELGALAFTQGNNIHFAPGQLNPGSADGQALLGHELTHVVQQREGRVQAPGGQGAPVVVDGGLEKEADDLGAKAAQGQPVRQGKFLSGDAGGAAIQREEDPEAWAERARGLFGRWCKVDPVGANKAAAAIVAPIDPKTGKKKAGNWGNETKGGKSVTLPEGTRVRVIAVDASDGAVKVVQPTYTKVNGVTTLQKQEEHWMHHYELVADQAPSEEADILAAKEKGNIQDPEAKKLAQQENAADQKKQNALNQAQKKLDCASMDALNQAGGALIDSFVPNKGDAVKLQIDGNIPIANAPGSFFSLRFVATAERDDKVKIRLEPAIGLMLKADLWLAEVFAKAMIFGYLEAQGDTGYEVMRLIGLALYKTVEGVQLPMMPDAGKKAADWIWGGNYPANVFKDMENKKDYVESGIGLELAAGFGGSGPGKTEAEGRAEARASTGVRLERDGAKLDTEQVTVYSNKANLKVSLEGLGGVELELANQSTQEGREQKGEYSGAVTATLNAKGFVDMLEPKAFGGTMASWATKIATTMGSLLSGGNALADSKTTPIQKISAGCKMVGGMSFGGQMIGGAVLDKLKKRYAGLEGAFGLKVSLKFGWEGGKNTGEVKLERVSTMESGKETDLFHILVENTNRIFKHEWNF